MEAWEANLPKLVEDDVSIVTIFEHQVRELMEDNEGSGLKYPQARQIVRSAWNLAVVGNLIRECLANYMEDGRFIHEI